MISKSRTVLPVAGSSTRNVSSVSSPGFIILGAVVMCTGNSWASGMPATSVIPQRGHLPGVFERTSLSIGQMNSTSGSSGTGGTGCCQARNVERKRTNARNMAAIFIIALVHVDKRPVETVYRSGKYLTFRVGRQDFAISAVHVRGILPVHQMEVVEGAPNSILGFAQLGGH